MNLLTGFPPETVCIQDEDYPINTDFRVSVEFENLMMRPEISAYEKISRALFLYFPRIPKDLDAAIDSILSFYRCGKPKKKQGKGASGQSSRAYSFEYDDQYIYAAFMQQYGIDLTIENMHWWKFRALFNSLSPETLFVKIMGWRTAKIDSKMPVPEKKRLQELKKLYALPRIVNEDERLSEIEKALMGNGKLDSLIKKRIEERV